MYNEYTKIPFSLGVGVIDQIIMDITVLKATKIKLFESPTLQFCKAMRIIVIKRKTKLSDFKRELETL